MAFETANPEDFWTRVNRLLKKKRLSQGEIAKMIGVGYPAFRGWSHRKYFPDYNYIYAISQVLKVPLNYLLFGEEYKPVEETFINNTEKIGETLIELVKLVLDEF